LEREILELHNDSPDPLQIWVEPWGEELAVGPGMTWKLMDSMDPPSGVSVTYRRDGLAIYVMSDAIIRWMEGERVVWKLNQTKE